MNPIEAARDRLTNHTLARSESAPDTATPPKGGDRASRIRATAAAREEARRVRFDRRRARRRARQAETKRQRVEHRADRVQRTATIRSFAGQIVDHVVVVFPIILVNALAIGGQVGFARDHLGWSLPAAIMFACTLESIAVYIGWHAHGALMAGDSAIKLRVASYLVAAVVGGLNFEHYAGHGGRPTVPAVTFGLMSLISPWLWAMHGRYANRQRLRELGLVDERAPHFSAGRWLHFPKQTMGALRWGISHNAQDPTSAWSGYQTTHTSTTAPVSAGSQTTRRRWRWGASRPVLMPISVMLKSQAPRRRHVICSGPSGVLFLRRPLPRKQPTERLALTEPAGSRVIDLDTVLCGPHSPIVYFVLNGDRVKIGTTQNLRPRVKRLCLRVDDIALVLHGDQRYEHELHERFADHRIGDTEWFELADELAAFVATGGGDSARPTGAASGAPVGDSDQPPTGDSDADKSPAKTPPGSRQQRPRAAAKKTGRRSLTEWVKEAGPIFHAEFERLQRQPTGDEFAEAIKKAGLGKVSPSTAKNIRMEILDRAPLPSLESEENS